MAGSIPRTRHAHPFYEPNWDVIALRSLRLKWESPPEPCHDLRVFITRSRDEGYFATASSEWYADNVMEIWDVKGRTMLKRLDTPNTKTSCLDWLDNGDFVTGGHDCTVSIWRNEVIAGE